MERRAREAGPLVMIGGSCVCLCMRVCEWERQWIVSASVEFMSVVSRFSPIPNRVQGWWSCERVFL